MRPWTLLVALFALAACAKEDAPPKPPETAIADDVPPKPPEVAIEEEPPGGDGGEYLRPGRLARGEPDAPAVHFRLRDGGLLQMKVGEEWKDATLDDCSGLMYAARDGNALEVLQIGKPEWEYPEGEHNPGSRLFMSIEAEPEVPWQHVQWLLTLAGELKYYKLQLSDGTRRLLAFIPLDAAIEWIPEQLPPYISLQIDVIARAGVLAKWDGAEVLRATKVAYRSSAVRYRAFKPDGEVVGGFESGNLAEAGPWIAKARKAAEGTKDARVVGAIKAGHKVPFARVLDAMDAFVTAGFPDVNLFAYYSIPSRGVRKAPRLPYPSNSYDPAD